MRARFAYISSLGTTAILVAAALLMLGVVSAIVAFRGWPGAAAGSGAVHSVPLAPGGVAKRVALVRHAGGVARGVTRASRAGRATRAAGSTAGLVKGDATGPRTVPGLVMEPAVSAPMSPQSSDPGPAAPQQQAGPDPAPEGQLPDQPGPTGPVPGGGALPAVPLPPPPAPSSSQPSADEVTTMVGSLLGNGPPPPLLLGRI